MTCQPLDADDNHSDELKMITLSLLCPIGGNKKIRRLGSARPQITASHQRRFPIVFLLSCKCVLGFETGDVSGELSYTPGLPPSASGPSWSFALGKVTMHGNISSQLYATYQRLRTGTIGAMMRFVPGGDRTTIAIDDHVSRHPHRRRGPGRLTLVNRPAGRLASAGERRAERSGPRPGRRPASPRNGTSRPAISASARSCGNWTTRPGS